MKRILTFTLLMGCAFLLSCTPKEEDHLYPNQEKQSYVEVKELGFKIPVEATLAEDLTYTIVDNNSAVFSSKTLNALNEYCGDGASGVIIGKFLGVPSGHLQGAPAEYLKPFEGFFFVFSELHDSCTEGEHVDLENKVAQAVKNGFQNLILIDY